MAKVTVLGLGAMGSRMAVRLLEARHEVRVWNRSVERTAALEQAGARVALTPRAATEGSDFVISMVRDDGASREVWLHPNTGALGGMEAGSVAVESSTLSPGWVDELSSCCVAQHVEFLDAPVAGSRPQADAGQLIYFVGGNAQAFARVVPLLNALGGAIHHVGEVGAGAAFKLAVNGLFAVQVAALGELLPMLRGRSIAPERAAELLALTPVCSPAAKAAAASMASASFAPLFPVELVEKDLGYLSSWALSMNQQAPVSTTTRDVFARGLAAGLGPSHLTSITTLYR
jgi:3-hydroxyisobutyrate dehydrogenase